MKLFNLLFIVLFISTLSACGGGGSSLSDSGGTTYNGSTAAATIDAESAEEIGTAAGESVRRAVPSSDLPLAISISESNNIDLTAINQLVLSHAELANIPSGIRVEGVCSSGTVDASVTNQANGTVQVIQTYNQCKLTESDLTVTGRATFTGNQNSDAFKIVYSNFRMSQPGMETITLNMTVDCVNEFSCTISSDFVGSDGRIHRVSSFSFTGDATSGYNGSATFYHGIHGRVSVAVSNITYGDCGTQPDGGVISFSSTNGTSGTITFNPDCSVSGTWNNGSTSGIF